eukprot:SAG22_NODE_1384_length_4534_cov_2.266516_3_plen_49_part_00
MQAAAASVPLHEEISVTIAIDRDRGGLLDANPGSGSSAYVYIWGSCFS